MEANVNEANNRDNHRLLQGLALAFFMMIVLRSAWISDDAYITLRTVDNFVNGYGLTWNTAERVQAYTHPLWMFLLSILYLFLRNEYYTTILLSVATSLLTVVVVVRFIARSWLSGLFAIFVFTFSRAFIDYSTSGLENPLTHLLLAIFLALYFNKILSPKTLFLLSFIASLAAITRMDILLIYAPLLAYAFWQVRTRYGFLALLLGQFPFIIWELFSVLYYGFPFPNTAYAKLGNGIPDMELFQQGLYYLLNFMYADPLAFLLIGVTLVLPFVTRKWLALPIVTGVLLYLLYTIKIGGDFMSGRFLTAPLLASVILLVRYEFDRLRPPTIAALVALLTVAGLSAVHPTLEMLFPNNDGRLLPEVVRYWDNKGVTDERLVWYPATGLLLANRNMPFPNHFQRQEGLQARAKGFHVRALGSIGFWGFAAGPEVHLIDAYALADPLMARIPSRYDPNWRMGHFIRDVPEGYIQTLETGENHIADLDLARYYDQLALITRGRILDPNRLNAIWKMNTGQFDALIHQETYRYPEVISVNATDVVNPVPVGTLWDAPGNTVFPNNGIRIALPERSHATQLEVSLDSNDDYTVIYSDGDNEVGSQPLLATYSYEGLTTYQLTVPPEVAQSGYTHIHIVPKHGDDKYALGHFRILEGQTN